MLTYRGIAYPYRATGLTTHLTGEVGKYRGRDIKFTAVDNPPPAYLTALELVYRGVPYTVGGAATEEVSAPEAATVPAPVEFSPIGAWMRKLLSGHLGSVRRREKSLLVRAAKDVGLPTSEATKYGSRVQGETPHDFNGYDRSSSAMS